nr:hypothetical protein [uncultured Oscillibacter sp.]
MFSMACAPFPALFALKCLDGDFDLPQKLFAALAHRHAQGRGGWDGAEIEDAHEILMAEIALRFQAAAGHHGIGDADKSGVLELLSDIVFIVFLQHASVNDVEKVLLVLVPI